MCGVEVSPDLSITRVLWEPLDDTADVLRLQTALEKRRGFLSQYANSYLGLKRATRLEFRHVGAIVNPRKLAKGQSYASRMDAALAHIAEEQRRQRRDERSDRKEDAPLHKDS